MPSLLLILAHKILNTMIYNYNLDNLIFTSIIFYFCHNALMYGYVNASSMSESLAVSLELEWKIL